MSRPRGVMVHPMPTTVCGPWDRYALIVRGNEARMVHTEGVAYSVTPDKPWRWNDYTPSPDWSIDELVAQIALAPAVDLADWVREFGARLECNFSLVYEWATRLHDVTEEES